MSKGKKRMSIFSSSTGTVIYTNDATNICYEASKSCYASPLAFDQETRAKYINARVREGHSSITEHSNCIFLLQLSKNYALELAEFLAGANFLRVVTNSTSDKYINVLLGGSTLGYRHAIANMYNQNNKVLSLIKDLIYSSCNSYFFTDLINMGIMDNHKFVGYENTTMFHMSEGNVDEDKTNYMDYFHRVESKDEDRIEILNADPIEEIYKKVKGYGFTLADVLDVCTVTIKFKGMSRIITQQLTRHRNAITQESQRYVDASNIKFNDPTVFKRDKYDPNKKYDITIVDYELAHSLFTPQELGDAIKTIYKQLREQGMEKEDARAYLPGNVQSNLYMTFTVHNLFHFLNLRMDSHAQAEIRLYANIICKSFFNHFQFFFSGKPDSYYYDSCIEEYLIPKCQYAEIAKVDPTTEEVIGDPEERIEQANAVATEVDPNDEMPDFGTAKHIAKPMGKSDATVEEIYNTYNPSTYADTRDDGNQ